jgi:hypothetical protein
VVGSLLIVYIGATLALNIPLVQRRLSHLVAHELSQALGAPVTIGSLNIGMMNRIVADNLLLRDRQGKEMVRVTRLSAKFDLWSLVRGKVSISSVQLFGFNFQLERATPTDAPNYQFVIDALSARNDTTDAPAALDVRINSLLMRRGQLSYNVLSEAETPGRFNAGHVNLQGIVASISLKSLQRDSINASIKRLSVEEAASGFELKRLSMHLRGNEHGMTVENFVIELPETQLVMDTIALAYNGMDAFEHFADSVRFDFSMLPSQVTPRDLSAFLPALRSFREALHVEVRADGTFNRLRFPLLSVSSGNRLRLHGDVALNDLSHPRDAHVFGNIRTLHVNREGIEMLVRNLEGTDEMQRLLRPLDTVAFRGEVSGFAGNMVTYGLVETNLGAVRTDLKLGMTGDDGRAFSYSGSVQTEQFELGRLTGNAKLGRVTFNLNVAGTHPTTGYPDIELDGLIAAVDYSGHTYENITLDGAYRQGGYSGTVALDDDDGSVHIGGRLNVSGATPVFDLRAEVDNLRPHELQLTPGKYEGAALSAVLKANFTGRSIDDMNGEINLDSLHFTAPGKEYFLDNLKITAGAGSEQHSRHIGIASNFLQATIDGRYKFRTLPVTLRNILHRYLPATIDEGRDTTDENDFTFEVNVSNTDLLYTVLNIPLRVYNLSTLKGYVNDRTNRLWVEGYFPRMIYKNHFLESGMLLCENDDDDLRLHARVNNRRQDNSVNLSLDVAARGDTLQSAINWGNSGTRTFSGKLAALAALTPRRSVVNIEPTAVILNDTVWNVHPSQVVVDSGRVHIRDFRFSHRERHLHLDGTLSPSPEDTVRLDLNNINIAYVFDIANVGVDFSGEATGPAYACNVLGKQPVMYTDLNIHNLGLNGGLLGDARIHGEWVNDTRGIFMDAHIREGDLASGHVTGHIYPLKAQSALDLHIEADNTNLKFIHHYLGELTTYFDGRATGNVRLYGKFNALTLDGRVQADAAMKVDLLNTTYHVRDSVIVTPDGLSFPGNRVTDTEGHQGRMSGRVSYTHFKDIAYDFSFDADNMLLMNLTEMPDFPFYGTVYGTGNLRLSGNEQDGLNVNAQVTTERNTEFTYVKDYATSAVSNRFVTFIDKTPRRLLPDSLDTADEYERMQQQGHKEEDAQGGDGDVHLNLLVDVTPEATMRIVMDPVAGDYISGTGTGSIRTEFYNKVDEVRMFGSYRIAQGVYKFSLQEVIRKDFTILDGSTINFNGLFDDTTLDIQANYAVNSVSLNDLIPNASDYVNQTNIRVNCTMNLSGQLTAPTLKLGLNVPTERDEVQALIRNYIPTDEQMSMQILYLLGIGKFYTPENVGITQNSNMMASVVSSTLSGQLNNALQAFNLKNINVGTSVNTNEGWQDWEAEALLSANLLNNRLLINGNFGYRENPMANTNFVGDFVAEWLVNRSGDIRLKAYNETNDRYYTKTNLTTQGIGIVFKKDFSLWRELIFWRRHKAKPAGGDTNNEDKAILESNKP